MQHGGDIYTDGLLKGRELLDFSSNINPLGVPRSFTAHLKEAVDKVEVYPDIQYRSSKGYICHYLNQGSYFLYPEGKMESLDFRPQDIVLGNGAGEIIDIAIASLKSICIVMPSFIEYEQSAIKNNVEIIYSNLDKDMNIDYDDLLYKIQQVDGVIVGNPNNPNGSIVDKIKFLPILEYCQKHNKRVIVDEAFIEFTGDIGASMIELSKKYSCLCIIRALTKFYGMPGVRIGYSICTDSNYNKAMNKRQIPWNINSFAELALKYVLKDKEYIESTVKWIREESEFFINRLKELKIIERVYQTDSNFVLVRLSNLTGRDLYQYLLVNRILIRTCSNYRNLDDSYVRFAIKSREDNNKLLSELKKLERKM